MRGAYYNELDPFAAAWLRQLIKEGFIADGEVDERSIVDVAPEDVRGFAQVHWFAGIGGWSYALRLAGWADDKPVWTGSCPCQPFSLAGAQKGFADPRHLWPQFLRLIAVGRPATIFGEQVASAAQWLRLVRGDLEALDYAVGAMPIQAACESAYHLRDRFWFVGHDTRERRGEGWPEHEVQLGQPAAIARNGCVVNATGKRGHREQDTTGPPVRPGFEAAGNSGVGLADANNARSQGWPVLSECSSEQFAGASSMADTRGGRRPESDSGQAQQPRRGKTKCPSDSEWVTGADGKARRVKPGICLLAHGVPGRVGKLRGFGNAIDPRPAAAFIKAAMI